MDQMNSVNDSKIKKKQTTESRAGEERMDYSEDLQTPNNKSCENDSSRNDPNNIMDHNPVVLSFFRNNMMKCEARIQMAE